MKEVILLRAVSNAGKTTFAELIRTLHPQAVICCADDYFIDVDGGYDFDATLLGEAHRQCKEKFSASVAADAEVVIVANTNTTPRDYKYYVDEASIYGYTVTSLVMENRHGGKNNHGVPQEVLDRQESSIRSSLKLQ